MPKIIVLMGPQGAGKGTQAAMLSEKQGLPLISTGDILREVAREDSDAGREVRRIQSEGRLVSDDTLAQIISERTARADCDRGCVLDGFPRTLPQAELLERISVDQGNRISVVNIEVPREILWKRLTGRRSCRCGATYNIYSRPSKREGICDLDGQPLFTRSDDNEQAIAQRLALYEEKTRPILDFYRRTGRLREVGGTGSPGDVFALILEALDQMDAGSARA
jgi:adenylate kinase